MLLVLDRVTDLDLQEWNIFIAIALIVSGIVGVSNYYHDQLETTRRVLPLHALGDSFGSEGDLFLGTGLIEGVSYYYYYYKTQTGFRMGKTESDGVEIRYSSGRPQKVIVGKEFTGWKAFWIPVFHVDEVWFEVPEGSVTNKYQLDLK